ncbi:aspartate-semialdehyde dehydrogenase [Notoacmeibacter marinus]|uniref:Aspartate-semialdehyde dehydrogenase n=1 Tax=Notoacmeibacter marinus TaxID=1876515 RepID=A0A231V2K1_9HYPH|nr:usg protein [Notoacmeibacter marinus]OXT02409.1 aspartate-semialdehyde dehydrogenase [Notoacmeibacter marinus]
MSDQREMELMLKGYGLTTAEILYRMPDHPDFLQTYLWQDYDVAPRFPAMKKFLNFWQEKLDGPLHSIRYCHRRLIRPGEWKNVAGEIQLH